MNEKANNKLKILVLTLAPWNYTNCTGSTQSSIFEGMDNIEVANIYCRYGQPDNKIVSRYYQITEKSMLNRLLGKGNGGNEKFFNIDNTSSSLNADVLNDGENTIFNWMRLLRLQIFYWLQELIWKTGLWKDKSLKDFVTSFNPDVLWIPIYYTCYTNNIALYLQKLTNKPMACYISDDNYTLKQFSLSPFYWIDRFIKRHKIKKVIKQCKQLYVITTKQKQEYDRIFNIKAKILRKGANFNKDISIPNTIHQPIKLVFMGSLGLNRYKSLIKIVESLTQLKKKGINAFLSIYTLSPLTDNIKAKLNVEGVSQLMPNIANSEIDETFQANDILIHCEPTDLKHRLQYRLSFSTKLVDYFRNGRCIVAYGGNTGSMDYLREYDAGIVIDAKDNLTQELEKILQNQQLIYQYALKCWNIGKLNHQIDTIQTNLYNDLKTLK